jgi:hypothetical protein
MTLFSATLSYNAEWNTAVCFWGSGRELLWLTEGINSCVLLEEGDENPQS